MLRTLVILVVSIGLLTPVFGQKKLSWKKQARLADELFEAGNYAEAATNYEEAWRKKRKKKELAFKTGESYYNIKDYRKAAEAYQQVKNENKDFPLVGLKYARCLKQDGQYEKATTEFQAFLDSYTGSGKAILEDIIRTEIEGCELGKSAPLQADRQAEILFPGSSLNSDDMEFRPFAASDNELYFSSDRGGSTRLYYAQRLGNQWSQATTPPNFPLIQSGHYGNACVSADGNRIYFTICSSTQAWDDIKTRCEIYFITRASTGWSPPKRLPDYINMSGVTATHPFVYNQNGLEFLFFASNREGGRGGMDLWYTTRDQGNDNSDFTFPINLGPGVNTLGDEITPFYNSAENKLFFASNGLPSMGGFDTFSALGGETHWSSPQNIGLPYNSSADDYGYVMNASRSGGFFASNRVFGGQKTTTRHSDVFEFTTGMKRYTAQGFAYDLASNAPLDYITVSLFEVLPGDVETLLTTRDFSEGAYNFDLTPNKTYKIEIQSIGYTPSSYVFSTNDPNTNEYGRALFLDKISEKPVRTPETDPPANTTTTDFPKDPIFTDPPPNPVRNTPAGEPYTTRGIGPNDTAEIITAAPRHSGTYYKVQLIAVRTFNDDNSSYDGVRSLGRFDTELIVGRNLTRVLLADFFSRQEAFAALSKVKGLGFPGAFVVRYENGSRYGRERQ